MHGAYTSTENLFTMLQLDKQEAVIELFSEQPYQGRQSGFKIRRDGEVRHKQASQGIQRHAQAKHLRGPNVGVRIEYVYPQAGSNAHAGHPGRKSAANAHSAQRSGQGNGVNSHKLPNLTFSQQFKLLATLQKARASAAVSDTRAKVAALRITLARLHAEVYGTPLSFETSLQAYTDYIRNQTALYSKRQIAFNEDIRAMEAILALSQDELQINRQLEASGDVSRAEILRLQRSVADIKAQLANKRNKYLQDAQAEMTKAQEDLSSQAEQLRDRSQVLEQTELFAPRDGIVNNIKVNTVGGVVRQGETIMEVLPTGNNLIVEAKISPADIAFVTVGQGASVKLDAYDSSIFGAMHGKVTYISPDVLTEETRQGTSSFYRVRIRLTGTEFKGDKANEIQLRPGLTASVEIKAMERSVLSYLTKPITKTFSQSLGER